MSKKIDTLCAELQTKINETDKRLKDFAENARNSGQKAKNEAKAYLEWLDNKAKEQRARTEAADAKIKAWVDQKKSVTAEKIAEWKAQRQLKKLADRADGAESYAVDAMQVAAAAVDEAEKAAVEAIIARLDADAVQAPSGARLV